MQEVLSVKPIKTEGTWLAWATPAELAEYEEARLATHRVRLRLLERCKRRAAQKAKRKAA
jgi:hypothetical protein